jgi:hypothetical protein
MSIVFGQTDRRKIEKRFSPPADPFLRFGGRVGLRATFLC